MAAVVVAATRSRTRGRERSRPPHAPCPTWADLGPKVGPRFEPPQDAIPGAQNATSRAASKTPFIPAHGPSYRPRLLRQSPVDVLSSAVDVLSSAVARRRARSLPQRLDQIADGCPAG